MNSIPKEHKAFTLLVLIILLLSGCSNPKGSSRTDGGAVVTVWNKKVIDFAIEEDNLLTLKGVRAASLMHLAMHDALNAIDIRYSRYSYKGNSPEANPIAAAAQAAYEVVLNEFPNKKAELDLELQKWLDNINDSKARAEGVRIGKESALSILKLRDNDTWNEQVDYTWHPMSPGVYAEFNEHSGTPEGFIFGAGWSKAKTFLLKSSDQFRSPPPPEINSEEYTKAFNEVKKVGATISQIRTKDQAHYAMWWKEFVEISINRLAAELVRKENLGLWETSRVFALLNMTIHDAYICVFDNKFYYNHWRPYTAIRWAANDGNDETEPDINWNTLHKHTYPFPSYPSAHGTAGSSGMTILANTLGFGDNYAFTMTIEEVDSAGPMSGKLKMNPQQRSFESFSDAGLECAMSRLYLGIHFRYDSEEGNRLGMEIGNFASKNYLTPIE